MRKLMTNHLEKGCGVSLYTAAAMLLCIGMARAQDTNYVVTLNGSATMITEMGKPVVQLTSAQQGQAGSVFTSSPIVLQSNYAFSVFFQFRMFGGSGAADGMTFVVQTQGPTALGGGGGSQGYGAPTPNGQGPGGIAPSVAVEFDTYWNSSWDINDNHVAVLTNGQLIDLDPQTPYGVTACGKAGTFGCMSNGDIWSVWVEYDGTNLNVALADNSTTRPANLITYPVNLASILGTNSVYVGFTAATGGSYQNHWVFNVH